MLWPTVVKKAAIASGRTCQSFALGSPFFLGGGCSAVILHFLFHWRGLVEAGNADESRSSFAENVWRRTGQKSKILSNRSTAALDYSILRGGHTFLPSKVD